MKMFKALVAAAALTALSASAASALSVDFGAGGSKILQNSISWDLGGGLTLTATAATVDEVGNSITGPSKVSQYSDTKPNHGGLGVSNAKGENHLIDGHSDVGANDLLILTFSKEIKLNGLSFSLADKDDDAILKVDGGALKQLSNLLKHPALMPLNAVGTVFMIGALGQNDEFKLRSIDISAVGVSTVPVPPALVLLATGLVGMGAFSRRRKRQG